MIKVSRPQEAIIILNVYLLNNQPQYIQIKNPSELKGEISKSTITEEDFKHISLTDLTNSQKKNQWAYIRLGKHDLYI